MTYKEIQDRVMTRLNLTSADARSRVKIEINDRYRELCSSVNLARTRRATGSFAVTLGTNTYTITNCMKLLILTDRVLLKDVLTEVTIEDIRIMDPTGAVRGTPDRYAIYSQDKDSTTIVLYPVPDANNVFYTDVITSGTDMAADGDSPTFPIDFHDILVHGTMADELAKMEKMRPLADKQETRFEKRSNDLRYFLLKSATKSQKQGDTSNGLGFAGGGGASGGVPDGSISYTQTGLISFVRGLLAPFSVQAGSAKVANLNVDLLDGSDWNTAGVLPDAGLGLTDVVTNNVTSAKHGFAPKSPADATTFLNGAATPAYAAVKDSDLSTSDVVTNDVTIAKHGFTPKAPNSITKFLRGDATWASVAGPNTCDGRLTLTTALPVTTADVTAAGTVFFTPYKGNQIATYSGAAWSVSTFTEKSVAVPAVANQMYDVFIVDGTLALEVLAWTSDSARATALVLQDGVWVKTGATTRRYLGSFRTLLASQTEDSGKNRLLWNYYNRVRKFGRVTDSTDTWNYTTAAYRQANGSTANQLGYVVGVAESTISLEIKARAFSNGTAAVNISVAIGEDSTTTAATGCLSDVPNAGQVANYVLNTSAKLDKMPAAGYHFYTWLEYSTAVNTTTWAGDAGLPGIVQTGLSGTVEV